MKKAVMMVQQALIISAGILLAIGLDGLFYYFRGMEDLFTMSWYTPLSILATGVLCSLASQILPFDEETGRIEWWFRIILHFLICLAVVSAVGHYARWYTEIFGYLFVLGSYVVIYALVWTGMTWFARYEERLINEALCQIQDEE